MKCPYWLNTTTCVNWELDTWSCSWVEMDTRSMDVDIDVLMEPGPSCHVLRCANCGASNEHGTRDAGVCLVSSARAAHFWRAWICAISSCPEYLSHFPALLWPGAAREWNVFLFAGGALVTWLTVAFSRGGGVARYYIHLYLLHHHQTVPVLSVYVLCTLHPGYLDSVTTPQTLSTHCQSEWTRTPDNRDSLFWALIASWLF